MTRFALILSNLLVYLLHSLSSVPSFAIFSFSRFGFIMRTDRQTDRTTEADDRYTNATTKRLLYMCVK